VAPFVSVDVNDCRAKPTIPDISYFGSQIPSSLCPNYPWHLHHAEWPYGINLFEDLGAAKHVSRRARDYHRYIVDVNNPVLIP
jgi:hypothetical protein